jgi:YggT family protein
VTILGGLYLVTRIVVLAALAYALLVAGTHWAVRSRKLSPFGAWPRFMRSASDRVLHPIERRILSSGGNPQDAPFWLLGIVIAGGLLLIWLVGWIAGIVAGATLLAHAGPADWVLTAVSLVFTLMELALIVRVVASWLGLSPYSRWLRPAYLLTNWIVAPLRRLLPTFGPFDFSPLLAWLLLAWVLRPIVMGILSRLLIHV